MNPSPESKSSNPPMRVTIRVPDSDRARAFGILIQHSAGTALPGNTFIISDAAAEALRQAGVPFEEVSREPGSPVTWGVPVGERI